MISDAFAVRVARWVTNYPWWIIVFTLLLVGAAASGARLLTFSNDYRVFFSEENPQLRAFQELERTYTQSDNVLIVVAPKDGQVFTRQTLAAVEALTEAAWQVPYSIRVDSLSNFQHTFAENDDLIVQDLYTNAVALDEEELRRIREVALNEPLLVRQLVSPAGDVTAVNITLQLPGRDLTQEVPQVVRDVRERVAAFEARHPELTVYLTGIVMLNNAFSEGSKNDMATLVPASFLIIIVMIGVLLRGWGGTLAAVAVILLSIVTALGLTGWLGIRLTPPSASAPLIILTVAVADTIHILTNFLAALRQGLGKQDAMVESLRINLQPVFLTSLTTAVGFLSMNFSDAPPFRDLGNMVAMGVVAAFFISVAFLPAVMMLLPVKPPPQAAGLPWMQRFGDFVVARRRALLPIMGVLIAGLVVFVPRNELNDVFVHYFDERVPFRVASEFANDHLSGIYRVDYSLRADQSGGISEPYFLQRMAAFAEWLREQPGVTHVNTLTDIFKRLNKNLHGDDPSFYRVPEERELAAQYLLLYEMSLPYGLDLNNQINVDKSAARLNVGIEIMSVQELLALQERARDWLAVNWPEVDSEGSGPTVMFSHLGKRNIQSMLLGTTIALVLISGILLLALRSVKMGLVSLMPNLVPAGMAFGLWGLLIGEVGISLSVVTAMTLGIVVDDTVHFLSKYLRARRDHGSSPADAVRYAFSTVGSALLITSVVLIAGFSVLALSSFWLNAGMGLLTAITIGFALIADFLFLPPLLMKVEEKAHEASIRDTAPKPASA